MIITEKVTVRSRDFIRTYSDSNRYVVRDGVSYSLIDANVYTPEQYPAGWEVV